MSAEPVTPAPSPSTTEEIPVPVAPSPADAYAWPTGSYYYDDATGYELYDPTQDDDDEDTSPPVCVAPIAPVE